MNDICEVVDIKGGDLHDLGEEAAGVGWHHDIEEGQHHEQLLGVDHRPELVK